MELNGKVAIVTGVSRGIGKATAEKLLQKGAKVAGWSRTEPAVDSRDFCFIKTDLTNPAEVKKAFESTLERFNGKTDILINNAGIGIFKKMDELSFEDWKKMFDINVHGIYHCCSKVVPHMKAQKSGHIINISSIAGLTGIPEATGYCGTKHAVKGISDAMFKELREFNIKVTCIYPGSVNTEFFENYPGVTANETMLNPADIGEAIVNVLEKSDNFLTVNMEIRPMNPRYK